MKHMLILAIIAAALGILLYKPLTTGLDILAFNREVKSIGWETCTKIEGPVFCEDIAIDHERDLVFFSCDTNRRRYNTVMNVIKVDDTLTNGDIWMYEPDSSNTTKLSLGNLSLPFHPLGISLDSSETSQSLIHLFAINVSHGGSAILHFTLDIANHSTDLTLLETVTSPDIHTPNSFHLVEYQRGLEGRPSFFMTNDHYFPNGLGKLVENYLLLPLANIVFYNARLGEARVIRHGLRFANGIATWRDLIFVVQTYGACLDAFRITNFDVLTSGADDWPVLKPVGSIYLEYAVDNIHVIPETGEIIAAGHPKGFDLLKYAKVAKDGLTKPASKIIKIAVEDTEAGVKMKVIKTMFEDNGEKFGTTSTGAIDTKRGNMIISGLYENGFLECKI